MKIGYACINRSIGCTAGRTFRLKSYSEKRLVETVQMNLLCLEKILEYNARCNILFFRITSDLIPFASHPVNKFKWQKHFASEFAKIGNLIRRHEMRISMHPDQFTLINSLDLAIFKRSVTELRYHANLLDLMGLDTSAKIQIHVGGVYKNKAKSLKRFISRYRRVDKEIGRRLVIENDDRSYSTKDCLQINDETGIPVLFDTLHHDINNNGEKIIECLARTGRTWKIRDGIPMIDYSHQKLDTKKGSHAETLETRRFKDFIRISWPCDFDIMLEIKDKERSALKATRITENDVRRRAKK